MNQHQRNVNKSLPDYIDEVQFQKKCISLPLEFTFLPVEILSKQFTKLNNNHPYRIHYLGTRPHNTLAIHKKYAKTEKAPFQISGTQGKTPIQKYTVDTRKIIESFTVQQKLRGNAFYKSTVFYRAFEGMNPTLNLEQQYIFNSIFQAGNLDCVIKVKQNQFDLFLRIDSNTKGHVQWFYFSVKNNKKKQKIKLNICNLSKPNTLYQTGMKPYVFSRVKLKEAGVFWVPGGVNLSLEKRELRYQYLQDKMNKLAYYCLQFQYQFEYQNDQVFFAYCVPFTYSKLIHEIALLPDKYVKKSILGKSLAGVNIPVLQISNFQDKVHVEKKNILITGRMHPGQSNSSHMLQGFIQFLVSNSKIAGKLRKIANFYIIPMVNPDGVIIGNTRTSTAGKDLNRQFLLANKDIYPEVSLVKEFAKKLHYHSEIFLYLDFHGHSKKKNTFCYGPSFSLGEPNYYKSRIFPKLIEKLDSNFRYHSCNFAIEDEKKQTARGVLFEQLKINFTYTIETSIGYFYNSEQSKTFQFSIAEWKKMGVSIAEGLEKFLEGYLQFEQLIRQRRASRQKRRKPQKSCNLQFRTQQEQPFSPYKKIQPLKITYNDKSLFSQVMEQIKVNKQQKSYIKQIDEDIQSDNNDQNQDFQLSKLKQFNNLLISSNQKEIINYKSSKLKQKKIALTTREFRMKNQLLSDEEQFNFFYEIQNNARSHMLGNVQRKQSKTIKQKSEEANIDPTKIYYVNRTNLQTQNNINRQKVANSYIMPLQYNKDMAKRTELNIKSFQQREKAIEAKKLSHVTEFLMFGFQESATLRNRSDRRKSSYFNKESYKTKAQQQNRDKKIMSQTFLEQSTKAYGKARMDQRQCKMTAATHRQSYSLRKSNRFQFNFEDIDSQNERIKGYMRPKVNKNNGLGPASFYGVRKNQNFKVLGKMRMEQKEQFKNKKQQISVVNFI